MTSINQHFPLPYDIAHIVYFFRSSEDQCNGDNFAPPIQNYRMLYVVTAVVDNSISQIYLQI